MWASCINIKCGNKKKNLFCTCKFGGSQNYPQVWQFTRWTQNSLKTYSRVWFIPRKVCRLKSAKGSSGGVQMWRTARPLPAVRTASITPPASMCDSPLGALTTSQAHRSLGVQTCYWGSVPCCSHGWPLISSFSRGRTRDTWPKVPNINHIIRLFGGEGPPGKTFLSVMTAQQPRNHLLVVEDKRQASLGIRLILHYIASHARSDYRQQLQ